MSKSLTFSREPLFCKRENEALVSYRNELHSTFNRQVGLLLESKMPRKITTTKGRLNNRFAYRHPFSENIFQKFQSIPSSDTTIIMLIDGSGSMDCHTQAGRKGFSRIQVCGAVASAFAKSLRDVLNDQVKFEVFVKHSPACGMEGGGSMGIKGNFPTLSRVFSNAKRTSVPRDYDELLRIDTYSPLTVDGEKFGSYTAEYSVLPCLMDWVKKNVSTKNIVVFNLTDGETYTNVGETHFSFHNEHTSQMRKKYLRGVPNMTLLLDYDRQDASEIYGEVVKTDKTGSFVNPMFKTLIRIIDSSIE